MLQVRPYVRQVRLERDKVPDFRAYPFCIPAVQGLDELPLHEKVTFLVGENGMGKSTFMEALAVACGCCPEGGGRNFRLETCATHSPLYQYLHLTKGPLPPRDNYFLRAESFYNVATEIENVADGVLKYYGDKSLHQQSHGESFLALLGHRLFGHGLYIFDEPEAALSPSRQMYMLCRMKQLAEQGSQFIISTHSPIVMSYPGAEIYEITDRGLEPTELEETSHFQLMKRFILDRRGILRQMELEKE